MPSQIETIAEKPDRSIRFTRSFRQLQTSVNRYLDDSGNWIGEVSDVLRELHRLVGDLDCREQSLTIREDSLNRREASLDELIAKLNSIELKIEPTSTQKPEYNAEMNVDAVEILQRTPVLLDALKVEVQKIPLALSNKGTTVVAAPPPSLDASPVITQSSPSTQSARTAKNRRQKASRRFR